MQIEVIQKRFTLIQNRFDILIEGKLTYKAKSVIFSVPPKIRLLDLADHEICCIQRQNIFDEINLPKYNFAFGNESMIRLIFESFTHYKVYVSRGIVDVYEQKGRKLGLFLDDKQVGIIEKNKIVKFGADIYRILINSTEINKELAIALALAYDNYRYDKGAFLNVDLGNVLINTEKEIDPNWKPVN